MDNSTPRATAQTLIETLKVARAAAAARDAEAIAATDKQVLSLASVEQIVENLKSAPHLRLAIGAEPIQAYVRLWGPTIAYYLDAAQIAQASEVPAPGIEGGIDVLIPAPAGDHPATIRVRCVPVGTGGWRIGRVEFAKPPAAVRIPASAPAGASP